MPLITVGLLNYNQGKYINFCFDSIKKVDYKNIEYIFSDDCSTDNSIEIAKASSLDQLTILTSKNNMGVSVNANKYIRQSSGDFIAAVCCDDGFLPKKLTRQLKEFEKDSTVGAVFTLPSLIDENNNPLPNEALPIFFNKNFNSRFEFLRYFFFNGNFLLGPSLMVKQSCYNKVGLYDPRLLQLQDFEMYIRMCLAGYELKLIEEPLTYYRIRNNNQNLSLKPHRSRLLYEMTLILKDHYSTINDPELLNKIFPMIPINNIYLMKFDLAQIALKTNRQWHSLFGLDLLYQLFKSEEAIELIGKERKFYPPDLFALIND